jgi:hypothetical protein
MKVFRVITFLLLLTSCTNQGNPQKEGNKPKKISSVVVNRHSKQSNWVFTHEKDGNFRAEDKGLHGVQSFHIQRNKQGKFRKLMHGGGQVDYIYDGDGNLIEIGYNQGIIVFQFTYENGRLSGQKTLLSEGYYKKISYTYNANNVIETARLTNPDDTVGRIFKLEYDNKKNYFTNQMDWEFPRDIVMSVGFLAVFGKHNLVGFEEITRDAEGNLNYHRKKPIKITYTEKENSVEIVAEGAKPKWSAVINY